MQGKLTDHLGYKGLCTRFATQITFQRASEESITVSILPAKDSRITTAEIDEWTGKVVTNLDAKSFLKIFTEVNLTCSRPFRAFN